jgi:hypothetical protein
MRHESKQCIAGCCFRTAAAAALTRQHAV